MFREVKYITIRTKKKTVEHSNRSGLVRFGIEGNSLLVITEKDGKTKVKVYQLSDILGFEFETIQ